MAATKPDLLGNVEIAALLGVKIQTVHVWRTRGALPPPDYTLSSTPVWFRKTIVEWALSTGRLPAPTDPAGAS